jgi:hypothetical protein
VVLLSVVFAGAATAIVPMLQFLSMEQRKNKAFDDICLAFERMQKDAVMADAVTTGPQLRLRVIEHYPVPGGYTGKFYWVEYMASGVILNRNRYADNEDPPATVVETKPVATTLDTANLPTYDNTINGQTYSNCFLVDMHTIDTVNQNQDHQEAVIRLGGVERRNI